MLEKAVKLLERSSVTQIWKKALVLSVVTIC